jgi:LysM repeat protein
MRPLLKLTHLALAAIVFVASFALAIVPAQAAPAADGPNLLTNPGFEGPYNKQCCHTEPQYFPNTPIDEIQVANGWRGWWLEPRYPDFPPTCGGCTSWHRPEWRASGAPFTNRYRSGANAQKYFTFYSVHKAGMYQQVSGLSAGQKIRFSVYMHAWSTNGGSLTSTITDNDMGMKVGIDPTGGTDPFSSRVIWSNPFNAWDNWTLYSVDAVAQGSTVTVFTHSQPRWGLEHNDIYIDDASLVVTDGSSAPPATATTAPTSAPGATNAPAATAVPTQPAAPTATPVPQFTTYTIQRGDSLYAIARRFGTTAAILQQVNGITNISRIFAGQVLKIPNPGASAPAPTTAPGATNAPAATVVPNQGQATTYTILRGDRLVYIARKFNTTLNAILAVNPGLDMNKIFAGQVINIPASQAKGTYTVQRGDNLAKIARTYGTTVAAIQAINGISNINTIFAGQVLLIP